MREKALVFLMKDTLPERAVGALIPILDFQPAVIEWQAPRYL